MTFWDWTQDNLALLKSPVMSATAFGGQGSSTRTETYRDDGSTLKCVSDGAFKNLRPSWLAISPTEVTKTNKGHCMFRNVVDGKDDPNAVLMAQGYNASNVARIQKEEYFGSFAQMLEGGPHGVIHASLGGEMNPTTSPNGELFHPFPFVLPRSQKSG
jgi:tyrosinase